MPVTELIERNGGECGNEVPFVEIDPQVMEQTKITWKE